MPLPPDYPLHCPIDGVPDGFLFDPKELVPLLKFLNQNQHTEESLTFQRGTVTKRQTLDCCKQDLGPGGAKLLTEALMDNDQIEAILFGTGGIGDEGAKSVGRLLKKNQRIHTVYLGCNLIGEGGIEALYDALADNSTVRALWLKRNPIGREGAMSLVNLLRVNRNIRTLDLVNTGIGSGLVWLIQNMIILAYPIERLYLSGNQIDQTYVPSLNQLLSRNHSLKELFLSVNLLGDEGVIQLCEGLGKNKQLTTLTLASNGITSRGLAVLLDTVQKHPKLSYLDLGYSPSTKVLGASANQLGDDGGELLAKFLVENQRLKQLDIRRSGISGLGANFVAAGILKNNHLLRFHFDQIPKIFKQKIQEKLKQNQQQHSPIQIPTDVLTIKSVYR
ncbi:MAG: ribonuclease inhibitor [Bacteroidota bacterium]